MSGCLLGSQLTACGDPAPAPKVNTTVNTEQEPLVCQDTMPGTATLRLLTRTQYNNTVQDLVGDDTSPANAFPPEHRVENFENNAQTHLASPLLVEKYWAAARAVSARAMSTHLDELAPCAGQAEADCAADFIERIGTRAFRRPITTSEKATFLDLYEQGTDSLDYEAALALVLEAMLQSPQFLYRVEARIAPTPETGAIHLGPYEMASRLSYFLWNTMPDDELFRAAANNELATAEQIEAQARRMLGNERTRAMVRDFHRQWLNLDYFEGLVRESSSVTIEPSVLSQSWKQSMLAFVDDVYWNGAGTVDALFSSDVIFVDGTLAQLYGVGGVEGEGFVPASRGAERAGLLTQPALMAMLAHADQSSPVQRGVFVRSQLLCDPPNPPPPTVNNNPPDPDPTLTTRERFRVHTAEPVCATCHELIDPLGFGLENYDQFGRYRAEENLLPVDASGAINEAPDTNIDGPFNGPQELASRLASSPAVRNCLATHWYRFAMGRVENETDECSLYQLRTSFTNSGGDLRELLVAMTLTDAFRYRPAQEASQ